MKYLVFLLALIVIELVGSARALGAESRTETPRAAVSGVLLVTLDTTRADALGSYGGRAHTPTLDALAASGVRFETAIAPSPLTLPSHVSLLTGAAPPRHGVLDNGTAVLGDELPTVASEFASHGWATGGFVASRVLDRRFGLARGFDLYDDVMAAEKRGEYGYPERRGEVVVDAALDWLATVDATQPVFLWTHFYDPHAPYTAPGATATTDQEGYLAEISYVDRQIGRLLDGAGRAKEAGRVQGPGRDWAIIIVGDHGEALGDHGERGHGIFLYRSVLEVPLIISRMENGSIDRGSNFGQVVEQTVAARRVAPSLLALAGYEVPESMGQPLLEGLDPRSRSGSAEPSESSVYSQSTLPASAYGWSRLRSLTGPRWKYIEAPRPELYDLDADPAESQNLASDKPRDASRLRGDLLAFEQAQGGTAAAAAEIDAELAASLRSLGYLSGSSSSALDSETEDGPAIDPKDGVAWLARLEDAKRLMISGDFAEARTILEDLVRRNPANVPFLSQLARARAQAGDGPGAEEALMRAIELNPRLDFLHANMGDLLRLLRKPGKAQEAYRMAAELNPRSARAWMALAEMAATSGDPATERAVLEKAYANGTASSSVSIGLGQIAAGRGDAAASDEFFAEAAELSPESSSVWRFWGETAIARGDRSRAIECFSRLVQLSPTEPSFALRLGALYLEHGNLAAARQHLERVRELAPESDWAREAVALLSKVG